MEPPSKRRKVSEDTSSPINEGNFAVRGVHPRSKAHHLRATARKLPHLGPRDQQARALKLNLDVPKNRPHFRPHRKQAAEAAIDSVVQVAVAGGDGGIITTLLVPAHSKVASLAGIGPITLDNPSPAPTPQAEPPKDDPRHGEHRTPRPEPRSTAADQTKPSSAPSYSSTPCP